MAGCLPALPWPRALLLRRGRAAGARKHDQQHQQQQRQERRRRRRPRRPRQDEEVRCDHDPAAGEPAGRRHPRNSNQHEHGSRAFPVPPAAGRRRHYPHDPNAPSHDGKHGPRNDGGRAEDFHYDEDEEEEDGADPYGVGAGAAECAPSPASSATSASSTTASTASMATTSSSSSPAEGATTSRFFGAAGEPGQPGAGRHPASPPRPPAGAAARAHFLPAGQRPAVTRTQSATTALETTIGEYDCVSLIGKGSFGKVFLAQDRNGEACAIKILPKHKLVSPRKQRLVADEKRVMVECGDHPFILSLRHAFQTPEFLCLVSEFCSGGELFFHLNKAGRFDENQVRFYCAEIACALAHLHRYKIAYRDLKSENLLLDGLGHIRLADFGLAAPRVSEWHGARSICGTPAYIAPEMIRNGGKCGSGYGYSIDYWSLGTLMYDFLCGQPPFFNPNMEHMCDNILSRPLTFPSSARISVGARDIIRRLLRRNPEARLGSSLQGGFTAIQQHPFFASIDWDTIVLASQRPAPVRLHTSVAAATFDTRNFDTDFTKLSLADNLRLPRSRSRRASASGARQAGMRRAARSLPAAAALAQDKHAFAGWDYRPAPQTLAVT